MKILIPVLAVLFLCNCKEAPKNEATATATEAVDTSQGPQPIPATTGFENLRAITAAQAMDRAKSENITGNIVGVWHAEERTGATLYLYEDAGQKLRMRTAFLDGNSMDNTITASKQGDLTRYDDDIGQGEYYLVESNGNLGLYGAEGKFDEAIRIEIK